MAPSAPPSRVARPLLALALCACVAGANAASYSRWSSWKPRQVSPCRQAEQEGKDPTGMWGCDGEVWDTTGPLAEWSFAGFGAGMSQPPSYPAKYDIKRDFGAAGDGVRDDTWAVQKALAATKSTGGVIYFPPGKYVLSGQLNISSNQVLRGAGRDATNLHFIKSMTDLYGWGPHYSPGKHNSPYTWSGALISTQRTESIFKDPSKMFLGDVSRAASRGDRKLFVSLDKAAPGKRANEVYYPGQWIAIRMYENKRADLAKAFINKRSNVGSRIGPMFGNSMVYTHNTRVTAVGADWIEFERPLSVDMDLMFGPQIYRSANFKVSGVGIEDLEISFPWTPYLGHHEEKGYNAIEFEAAVNSWIRRVRIVNADAAIKLYSSHFNTISDVQIRTSPKSRAGGLWNGRTDGMIADKEGHIGIALHWACFDNLVEKFDISSTFYHELLVAGYSAHNVFTNGKGTDLTLDHHGAAPHNNLWTDIDVGAGKSTLDWSGDPQHFPYGGSNNVFWNIYASQLGTTQERSLASNRRAGPLSNQRIAARQRRLPSSSLVYNRPASEQGFGQVVVDMPVDTSSRYIREAGDWLIQYNPYRPVYPSNLYDAMKSTQSRRLRLAGGQVTRPSQQALALLGVALG